MEFTVSKADLVRELSLSQGVVEKKTTIPILSNVLLEASGDRLTLTATDLELGIRCSCPARVKKEGAGTVPARKLLDYVRLLPEGDVNMKFLENHWASITMRPLADAHCRHVARKLSGTAADAGGDRGDSGEDAGFDDRAHVSSRFPWRKSRFTLNGALLLMRPEGLTMVATDGHRLAFVQAPSGESGQDRPAVPRAGSQEGHGRADQTGGRCGRRMRRCSSPATTITCSFKWGTGC